MSAATLIKEAAALGVRVDLEDDGLTWESRSDPPDELLSALKANKAEIVALLQQKKGHRSDDIAKCEADEGEFQRQLALLREANAKVYATRTPWRCK